MSLALRPPVWPTYVFVCAHVCAHVCAVQGCGAQPSSFLQLSPGGQVRGDFRQQVVQGRAVCPPHWPASWSGEGLNPGESWPPSHTACRGPGWSCRQNCGGGGGRGGQWSLQAASFPESTQPYHAPAAPCCLLSLQQPPTETTLVLGAHRAPCLRGSSSADCSTAGMWGTELQWQ